jgi:hypothetical protein
MKKYNGTAQHNPFFKEHNLSLQHGLYVGESGAGKTSACMSYLQTMQGCFKTIQIYCGMPHEKIYKMIAEHKTLKDKIKISHISEVPAYDDNNPCKDENEQHLIIFDDFITSSKSVLNIVEKYVTMGRKYGYTCLFLSQSFFLDCLKIIRNNVRYVVLLNIPDEITMNNIVRTVGIQQIPKDIIKKIIRNSTKEELNIMVIDKKSRDINKKFRRNYNVTLDGKTYPPIEYYKLLDDNDKVIENVKLYNGSGIVN